MRDIFRRLAAILSAISRGDYPYSKLILLLTWLRLIIASVRYHKFTDRSATARPADIFGYQITFDDYGTFLDMFEEIFIYQVYKFESTTDKPFIIDCGSNIGLASLYFKILYPGAIVSAFEPDPAIYPTLSYNMHHNRLNNVRLHNVALDEKDGQVMLFKKGRSVNNTIVGASESVGIPVKGERLSDHIAAPLDLLKMDIEGAEEIVVAELIKSGKISMIKRLILEYHDTHTGEQLDHFINTIESTGFKIKISRPSRNAGANEILLSATRLS